MKSRTRATATELRSPAKAGTKRAKIAAEDPRLAPIRKRNQAALRLLHRWQADESGYDESVWPGLKRSLEKNRLSSRRLFRD
jgi:hypothetical protein